MDTQKLLRSLTVNPGILIPHIDAYQDRGEFPDEWVIRIDNTKTHDDDLFHPSTDAFTKPKELYMQKVGLLKSPPITHTQVRVFSTGHFCHAMYGQALVEMGFVKEENVERQYHVTITGKHGEANCRGTIDLGWVQIPGHGEWLVDMKTMNKRQFEAGATPGLLKKWNAQVNIYGDWIDLDQMLILAIEKDYPHRLREYVVQKDNDILEEIYDRWSLVADHVKRGVAPE